MFHWSKITYVSRITENDSSAMKMKKNNKSLYIVIRSVCWTINVIFFSSQMASNSPYADLVDRPLFGETRSRVRKYETFLQWIANALFYSSGSNIIHDHHSSYNCLRSSNSSFLHQRMVNWLFNECLLKFFLGNLCWHVSFQTHQWDSYFPEYLSYTSTWLAFMSSKSFEQVSIWSICRFFVRHFGTDQVN